ncbi:MATE family efflux transporter [Iodidimonas nitroreducens]|nr:MATE family efflux transporter [Iodidimonas nitroreducens]
MMAPLPDPHRRIWRIAGPAILASISGPLVGIVDSWALGHLPDPVFLAAIALGAFVFHFIYWSFGFLRMGTSGLVAQAFGRDDPHQIAEIMLRSLILGGLFGVLVILLQKPLLDGLFALLQSDRAEADLAMRYCLIRIWGAPFILVRLTVIGFLIGRQRTRLALLIELWLNLSNAVLTIALVQGFGMAIAGAAFASLAAELSAALVALVIAARMLPVAAMREAVQRADFWQMRAFLRLLSVNGALFVRTLFLLSAFALLWRSSANLGTLYLGVNQILIQFLMLTSFGLDGMAYAAEALVGEAVGRRNGVVFRQMVRITMIWALAMALVYSLIFWLLGASIIHFFTDLDALRSLAYPYLPWVIVMPVIALWSYQFDGIFIGATRSFAMMWTMIGAFALYGLALLILLPLYGNHGLWASLMIFLAARGLLLAACYPGMKQRVMAT